MGIGMCRIGAEKGKEGVGVNNVVKWAVVAVILAAGMVFSSALLSKFFVRIRHEQAITVKGYAETDITSDTGMFYCTCNARGTTLQEAYTKLQAGKDQAVAYLNKAGFSASEIEPGTIETIKISKKDAQGRDTNETEYFDVYQTLTVSSSNVALIRDISTRITELIKEGIDIRATSPEFYVSDLKDTKLNLLARATEDGYRRALALAGNSQGKVGALQSAQQGVFQITRRNSTDTSSYGEYDTCTIEKTAKAVVTLQYTIEPVQ